MGVKLGNGNWAVKEDKLLAYNDKSGKFFNKEFDFTRGSGATYVAKDGLIKTAGLTPTNLVQNGDFSQEGPELVTNGDFSTDSDWIKGTGWSIADGKAICTNGNNHLAIRTNSLSITNGKVYKVQFTVLDYSSGSIKVYLGDNGQFDSFFGTFNSNGTYTVYHKLTNSTANYLIFRNGANGSNFSIDNVSVKEVGQNWQTQSDTVMSFTGNTLVITNNSSGRGAWQNLTTITGRKYRFEAKSDSHVTDALIRVTNSSFPSSGFGDAYVVGGVAVLEFIALSTTTNLYLRNSTIGTSIWKSASVKEIETDTPRIDFSDSPNGALLLEPSSTNHIKKSEKPEDWTIREFGSGGVSTVTTGFDDVMGGKNAVKVDWASDADNAALLFDATSLIQPTSSNSLITVYVKLLEEGTKIIRFRTNNGSTNVTINSTSFTRIQGLLSSVSSFELKCRPTVGTSNGGYSLIVCQPQIEDAVFATSYIPTYGTTATRLAETCNNSGSAQDFNSEEGVFYAEIGALSGSSAQSQIELGDGSDSTQIALGWNGDRIRALIKLNNTSVLHSTYDTGSDLLEQEYYKVAVKYKSGQSSVFIDGVEIATSSTTYTNTDTISQLGFQLWWGGTPFYGKVKNLRVYTEALTDAQLQSLTTI